MSHVPGWFPWLHSILSASWGVSFSYPHPAFLMALMSGDPLSTPEIEYVHSLGREKLHYIKEKVLGVK